MVSMASSSRSSMALRVMSQTTKIVTEFYRVAHEHTKGENKVSSMILQG